MKNFIRWRQFPKLLLLNFLAKFVPEIKYLMNNVTLYVNVNEIIKSINSQTNNESPGNYGLTAGFYIHFSKELAPAF